MAADAVELNWLALDALGRIKEERQLVVDSGGQRFPTGVARAEVARSLEHEGGTGVGQHVELQGTAAVQADAIDLGCGNLPFQGHLR